MILKKLPELKLPPEYRNRDLPVVVDNSEQPYLRPVFNQEQYCCGQAAGIAYNFTYEINRERNLPANVAQNQYPTHFTWNWLNSGYGWYGVSYLHSFQVLKYCGDPNVVDYGGTLAYGGPERWMSGYDEYYNGMHNRISNVFQLHVNTPEGLLTFKHWIHDHLEGATVGGVACYYAQYMSASTQLPPGTPEEGKYVLTYFGGSANHAMTIVGYHDSIRYDYNNDGQYTNDIDINGDGVVDMKDWEIGGFKMVQSYGGVPGWGDQGFAYMMYKTVADDLGDGGIWNHCVHILDVKEDCEPQLTMKVILKHTCRDKIKVTAGISPNINDIRPEYLLEFPIFNYQGGTMYMQGGTSQEENKTIELGLDITPLLSEITPGQNAKFFLQVDEDDPVNAGTGEIIYYAIIDYSNGVNEIPCPQTNVPLNENDTTILSITASINFDKVTIVNNTLPPAPVGVPYSCQMIASNGASPYRWHLYKHYEETSFTGTFPAITQTQLTPSNNVSGFVTQQLDFSFPFYDSSYTSITVHVDGYLMFDEQLYPYPYFNDDMVLFTTTRHISPFMTQELRLYSSQGDKIWYDGDQYSATFRWKASLEDQSDKEVNIAVKLYPSGVIEYYYGNINVVDNLFWIPGISDGNDENYQFVSLYNDTLPYPNQVIRLYPYDYPSEMFLSEEGVYSGTPQQAYNGLDIIFRVTDNNFIYNYKTLPFSSSGIVIEDSIISGNDNILEYGETAYLSVALTNIEENPITDATMTISSTDSLIIITDSVEYLGTLPVGQTMPFINAFSFDILPNIPNAYPITLETSITGNRQTWISNLFYIAYAPDLGISEVIIEDGMNGRLDPGETTDIHVLIQNTGGATSSNINTTLSSVDPWITINVSQDTINLLEPYSIQTAVFNVTVSEDANIGHIIYFDLDMVADLGYTAQDQFSLMVGLTVEDFETGNFSSFCWGFDDDKDWMINDIFPYEGIFCAKSGNISHNQESSLIIDLNVLENGEIGFFKKVSCEDDQNNDNYDYLAFYIDGYEMGRWDGQIDWSQETFPITTGFHRVKWNYHKDQSVSTAFDCIWLDFISLPSCIDAIPQLIFNLDSISKAMKPDKTDIDTLIMTNAGDGDIKYGIWISAIPGNISGNGNRSVLGSYLECDLEAINSGESYILNLTVYNASDDNEWIRDINIDFPEGMEVTTATNFTGGSLGDLVYDGTTGYGVSVNWHGEDPNGWGVIKGSETAVAQVTIFLDPDYQDNAILSFEVIGDIYGNEPHVITGDIQIINLGSELEWISIDSTNGAITAQTSLDNLIHFNTEGMDDGEYVCEIIINEQFQRQTIIPVFLIVDQSLSVSALSLDESGFLKAFPNPFMTGSKIMFDIPVSGYLNLCVHDLKGNLIRTLIDNSYLSTGQYQLTWDGKDNNGTDLPDGIYLVTLRTEKRIIVEKLIKLK